MARVQSPHELVKCCGLFAGEMQTALCPAPQNIPSGQRPLIFDQIADLRFVKVRAKLSTEIGIRSGRPNHRLRPGAVKPDQPARMAKVQEGELRLQLSYLADEA